MVVKIICVKFIYKFFYFMDNEGFVDYLFKVVYLVWDLCVVLNMCVLYDFYENWMVKLVCDYV